MNISFDFWYRKHVHQKFKLRICIFNLFYFLTEAQLSIPIMTPVSR